MTAGERQRLKEGLPGLSKLSKLRFKNATCCNYIPASRKVRNVADGLSLAEPPIGGLKLLLSRQRDCFNRQPFYVASVRRCGTAKSTGDTKSILIHAAAKHRVCLEQRESRRP